MSFPHENAVVADIIKTSKQFAEEMAEPVETIRVVRRVAASELSLDAPIDRRGSTTRIRSWQSCAWGSATT